MWTHGEPGPGPPREGLTVRILSLFFLLGGAWGPCLAHADEVVTPTYHSSVSGNTVKVLPSGNCDESRPLLRHNVETGEVVSITDCVSVQDGSTSHQWYADECVPAGRYRYGLESPIDCVWFTSVSVTSTLDPACTRSAGLSAPVTFSGAVPWADDTDSQNPTCPYSSEGFGCSVAPTVQPMGLGLTMLMLLSFAHQQKINGRRGKDDAGEPAADAPAYGGEEPDGSPPEVP